MEANEQTQAEATQPAWIKSCDKVSEVMRVLADCDRAEQGRILRACLELRGDSSLFGGA